MLDRIGGGRWRGDGQLNLENTATLSRAACVPAGGIHRCECVKMTSFYLQRNIELDRKRKFADPLRHEQLEIYTSQTNDLTLIATHLYACIKQNMRQSEHRIVLMFSCILFQMAFYM